MQGFKVVTAMVIWGSLGVFVKNINLPSLEIAFLRAAIASCFLIIAGICLLDKKDLQNIKKNLFPLLLSGAAIGLNWVMLFQAYQFTSIANATLSYYFAPVFVILLSPFVLKEKLQLKDIISIIVAMTGLFIVVSQQPQVSADVSTYNLKGIMFGLFAAGLYASIILINKNIKGLSGYPTTVIQILTAALVLLPFVIYRGNLHITNLNNLGLLLILGIVHTGLAYLLYFSGMQELKAKNIAILSYIDPVSAIIFGILFLGEPITLMQAFGGLLILGSTLINK
jgi:RarD protein